MSFGMTVTVAPLTTTVMNAVPKSNAGVASGINNAVSRLASLIAVAAFSALLVTVFVHALNRQLASLRLPSEMLSAIQTNHLQLAAMKVPDDRVMNAIAQSFVHAYRTVLWVASGSLLLASCFGWLVVTPSKSEARPGE